jgi:hypothetical protein
MNGQTKVLGCNCKHEFQDQRYGKGMRLHNQKNSKTAGVNEWRCTVCKSEKSK